MSDELDKLEKAFREQDEPERDENARKIALNLALANFQEKKSASRQGIEKQQRQTNQVEGAKSKSDWRNWMSLGLLNSRKVMMAGVASLCVLIVAGGLTHSLLDGGALDRNFQSINENINGSSGPHKRIGGAVSETPTVSPTLNSEQNMSTDRQAAPQPAPFELAEEADSSTGASPNSAPTSKRTEPWKPRNHASRPLSRFKNQAKQPIDSINREHGIALSPANQGTGGLYDSTDITVQHSYQEQGRDKFEEVEQNQVKLVKEEPVSTFSIDVDTASYAFMRRQINAGVLPQKDAIRVEELINYFDYSYLPPSDQSQPFSTSISISPAPWNIENKLIRIGIKGYELEKDQTKPANIVFLIDTSGSMSAPDKLPLLVNSFKLLLSSLKADDTISIVAYAGSAGTVLEPTKVADKNKIISALDKLQSGGSTAGGEGIRLAYQLAENSFKEDGTNRIILATDGDFNVGIRDKNELKSFIERKRKTGVTLSVLGFGQGNYNDALMQALAQNGNGNAAYIDTLNEARKVLVEQAGSTLFTIAKDVKIQVEFNPQTVQEYRLIGYETRKLNREDFNNDKVDAGDIGAGHSVTALYEITPVGGIGLVEGLRYQNEADETSTTSENSVKNNEYGFLKIRYKQPDSDTSQLITQPITRDLETTSIEQTSIDNRFATAVAAFGQLLKGGRYLKDFTYDDVISLAVEAKGKDEFGYRAEFINLVRLAKSAADLQKQR